MDTDKYKVLFTNITICVRNLAFIGSVSLLSIGVKAAAYQTYVLPTYGGNALLPAVRQQLNTSTDGGSVAAYQDKLVLHTTLANYQAMQQLLTQIDGQPQALTIAVRVGNSGTSQSSIQQGRVIISNHGIQGAGIISQNDSQQNNNNTYQVQTLSGSTASISTGTLYSLTQSHQAAIYPTYNRPSGRIIIQQQVLLPTTQGIKVTPRLLPNGQVEVTLTQVEEELIKSNFPYNQNHTVQGQTLNSTIIVPRGQWITIGQIAQNTQNQSSDYGNHRIVSSNNSVPISLLVQ